MRKLYKARKLILDNLMLKEIPNVSLIPSDGGMHSVYCFQENLDDIAICKKANQQGLGIRALSSYQRPVQINGNTRSGIIVGYAGMTEEQIQQGVLQLRDIINAESLKK
jgi:GntR family transcriptional regulator/MocR family aminotransferase